MGYVDLTLNPDKTTCTLFTPDPAAYKSNLDIRINNTALPMATHPKVLILTLDPKLTFSTHIYNISVQAHKPLQMIKALTVLITCGLLLLVSPQLACDILKLISDWWWWFIVCNHYVCYSCILFSINLVQLCFLCS